MLHVGVNKHGAPSRLTSDGKSDLVMLREPVGVTEHDAAHGIAKFNPLADWSHDDVRAYLAARGVELPPMYGRMVNAPECARCTAWWGEGRGAYLAERYPDLHRDYAERMRLVMLSFSR